MRFPLALILCCVVAVATFPAPGQPAGLTRVLRRIDFEERRLGNQEDLPMHWVKVEGPGFPHYVNGVFASDRARSGGHSFKFELNGGSLVYRYDARQVKVTAGACYRAEAWVQTTPLEHARARVSGYYVDQDAHPLPLTVRHSELYASAGPGEGWHLLTCDLPHAPAEAGYFVVELALLQPQVYAPSTLGQRTIRPQEIRGSAWFDDVVLSQIPRVRLSTDRPGNLFRRSDPIVLTMDVNDAFIDDLVVQLVVRDALGRTAYQRSGAVREPSSDERRSIRERIQMPLPTELPPGWYEASVTLSSQGQALDVRRLRFVRFPDDSPPPQPDERFGLIATELPSSAWKSLPSMLPQLGVGRVKLGVWTRTVDAERQDPAGFDATLARLRDAYIHPTACLVDLPPGLAAKLNGGIADGAAAVEGGSAPGASWARLLKAKDADWQGELDDLIARHAPRLERWQIGPDGSDVFVTEPAMRDVYAKVYQRFAALVRHPDLAMPWPAWYELDGQLPATLALSVPSSVLPSQLPLYTKDLRGSDEHQHLSLGLALLDRQRYGREMQIKDLAQRVIYALAAGADRVDLPAPFSIAPGGGNVGGRGERDGDGGSSGGADEPHDLFPIYRTLLVTLGHARYVGRIGVAEDVEAFLFDRDGEGVLALWDTGRSASVRELPIYLGESPRLLELEGSEVPLVRPADDPASGTVRVPVGPMPVFLTNVDGPLAQLRASVTIDKPLIESTFAVHPRRLRFRNSYARTISGSLRLKAPSGWTIQPTVLNFTLGAGESFDREIAIEFPVSSTAGTRSIGLEFIVEAERTARFQMPLQVKLGLSDVGMQTMAIRDGDVVIVQQIIQNYGDKPVDYTAFALIPGYQRQERLVTTLRAGDSTIKRYRFTGVKPVRGLTARAGIKELDGSRMLNDEVEIP